MPLSLDIWSRNTLCKIGCQSKIGCPTNGLSNQWAVGPMGCRTNGLSNQWAVGILGRNRLMWQLTDRWRSIMCLPEMAPQTSSKVVRTISQYFGV